MDETKGRIRRPIMKNLNSPMLDIYSAVTRCPPTLRRLVTTTAIAAILLGVFFASLISRSASAQEIRTLQNPVELASKVSPRRGGDVNFDLNIRYGDNLIPNPSTGNMDKVHLRSYNGQLVGPTMRVRPGQLLRVLLQNDLPVDDPSCKSNQDMSIPHCYNSTNLHTHGWHVSPTGNSDNVLLDLGPGTNLDYEYYLPKDHPAGTFWYHSHRHGSTALQVSSGMAGALIVEGFRTLKDKPENGIADIDTILKTPDGRRFKDRIFTFEQIQYYCGFNSDGSANYDCTGKVGEIESYAQFGPDTWGPSGRFTLINGQLQPVVEMQAGQIERWRLIHGGVRDTINFAVTKSTLTGGTREDLNKAVAQFQKATPAQQKDLINQFCGTVPANGVKQIEFAVDGLTREQMSVKKMNILQPGYRSDLLMSFSEPGIYCALDAETTAAGSINGITPPSSDLTASKGTTNINDTRLLSLIFVSGGMPYKGEPAEYTAKQLIAANEDLPAPVLKDLQTLRVPEYVPHRDVEKSEVTGYQELSFAIRTASDNSTTLFQIANKVDTKEHPNQLTQLDYYSYDPDRIDRTLTLGGVDQWTLTSGSIGHPFHIHVNPFQIIQILKPDGTPVVDASGKCTDFDSKGVLDPEYCDQIGVWRDTLFIKNPTFDPTGLSKGYRIIMRTRYERYIGDFVLHCHILDHEDQGMMQNIRIAPKGGYLEENPTPTKGAMKHGH
jgi:L-ascorbate oxidase